MDGSAIVDIVTEWLDDEEMLAWRGLVDLSSNLHATLEAELLEAHGITEGDYGVLACLSEAVGQRLRMCDLAGQLHLSPSGLTRRLDGLVREGYVVREQAPDDRRVMLAALTQAGFAKLAAAAPDHVAGVRRHLFDHLSRTQVRQLGSAFSAVRRRRV